MVSPSTSTAVEFVGVKVRLHTSNIYITCPYIPPASDIAVYLEHLTLVKNISCRLQPTDKLIVLGAFNLSKVSWVLNDNFGRYIPFLYLLFYKDFFNGVHALGLLQQYL